MSFPAEGVESTYRNYIDGNGFYVLNLSFLLFIVFILNKKKKSQKIEFLNLKIK